MKKFLFLLFPILLYGQVPQDNFQGWQSVQKTHYYLWTAVTGKKTVTADQVNYKGTITKVETTKVAGSKTAVAYLHKKIGLTQDSLMATTQTILTSNLMEDTTYTYWLSVTAANGKFSKGNDSTFITLLHNPTDGNVTGTILAANLFWNDNSSAELGYAIERDTVNGSNWVAIDTVTPNTVTYKDSGSLAGDGIYKYRVRALGYYSNSNYLSLGSAVISRPFFYLTFNPETPSYTTDSTKTTSGGEIYGIRKANFEGDSLTSSYSGFNSITDGGVGAELTIVDTAKIHETYGFLSKQINPATENDNGYGTITFTARDSLYVRWYMTMSRTLTLNNANGVEIFCLNAINNIQASNFYVSATTTGIMVNKLNINLATSVAPAGWEPDDTLYCEAFYKKGTGSNGVFKFWINGTLKYNVSNLTTTQQCSTATFGVCNVPGRAASDWWIKYDDIKISDSYIGTYTPTSVSADSNVTVYFKNTSGKSISVTGQNGLSSPFTYTSPSIPFTVSNNDSQAVVITIDRDKLNGVYSDVLNLTETYVNQSLPLTVNIVGDTSGSGIPKPSESSHLWFVSNTGNGSQTGTDSANAWSPNSIVWDSLSPGDSLLFITGNYNLTNTIVVNASGTANNLITIMPYKSGTITFYGNQSAFEFGNDSYVKIKKFRFRSQRAVLVQETGSGIYLDSLDIRKFTTQGAISINGWNAANDVSLLDSTFVRWCTIIADSQINQQTDCIFVQFAGNVFLLGNYIENQNIFPSQHIDCIQTTNYLGKIVIANNYLKNSNTDNSHCMMLNTSVANDTTMIYNNVCFEIGTAFPIEDYFYPGKSGGKTIAINNTIVSYNDATTVASFAMDNVNSYSWNNIVYTKRYAAFAYVWYSPLRDGTNFTDIDYNYYRMLDNRYVVYYQQSGKSWTTWQGYGADAHSNYSTTVNAPLFADLANGILTLQSNSPCKNVGTNKQTLVESFNLEWKTFNNTITGNAGVARDATPDLGAY